jgi:3-hydroxyisobutyrate dehydrogenase
MIASSKKSVRLGFIGVGAMGLPMVDRLIAAGHRPVVWDLSPQRLEAASHAGADVAGSAAEVARSADIVFLCLTDASAVETVVLGFDAPSSAPRSGAIVVDFSSIPPVRTRAIAARLKAANGMSWVDAPVSGGPTGAKNGTLAVMAGGDLADLERVKPYVLTMSQRFTHMGPTGAGQATKLCNQIIAACAMVVISEATRFAVDVGIDAARLPEALAGGFADSIPLQLFVPRMANNVEEPAIGAVSIILKDLDTIAEVAREHATPLPMASLAAQMFRLLRSSRGPNCDVLDIFKLGEPLHDGSNDGIARHR